MRAEASIITTKLDEDIKRFALSSMPTINQNRAQEEQYARPNSQFY